MVRNLLFIFMFLSLIGCMSSNANTSSSKPLVNDDIREVNLMSAGKNKYNLQIRGNYYSEQIDLRKQFTQEVEAICKNDYEVSNLKTSEITHTGVKKPILEGDFICG